MFKAFNISILFLICSAINAQEKQWILNSDKSQISYTAKHLLHAWEGVNKKPKAIAKINTLKNNLVEIAVLTYVRDFDSKNSGRDAHALEVLEALSYPEVRFYANQFEPIQDSLRLEGTLMFHGVSKPLSVNAHIVKGKSRWVLSGGFTIQPTDFEIELPSFMMVKMEDTLRFEYNLTFDNHE